MLRRFLKKAQTLNLFSNKTLQNAVGIINYLPRKIHNWLSADEVYYGVNKKMIAQKQRRAILFAFRT